jgi:hypothetical protein
MATLTTYTDAPVSAAVFPASLRVRSSMMNQLSEAIRIAHPKLGFEGTDLDEGMADLVWAIWKLVSEKHVVPLETPSTEPGTVTMLDVEEPPEGTSLPVEAADLLDWDAVIDEPPARRSGMLSVQLEYQGRDKPVSLDNPWAE